MIDGIGEQHNSARDFSRDYFAHGCLTNAAGLDRLTSPLTAINQHALFDAARRWSQYVRMVPRQQLIAYAVIGGKSVLWFRRYSLATGAETSRVPIANGTVERARRYEVSGADPEVDFIDYNGVVYGPGDKFVGISGVEWWSEYGSPVVSLLNPGQLSTPAGNDGWYAIADAIALTAPKNGWSNRWLLGVEFHAYHSSESSLWKPPAYSDYFAIGNRCHFYSPEIANDDPLLWHTAFGQRIPGGTSGGVLNAESPSGWNYARLDGGSGSGHVNHITPGGTKWPTAEEAAKFYRSCRIYEPDIEIEEAVSAIENGEEVIRVTLLGRLHNTSGHEGGAPASIDRDLSSWDADAVAAEPYRTAENGLRAYLLHAQTGRNFVAIAGDDAANSMVQALTDNPFASIYPLVCLTKLIPEPYDDGNDSQDTHDTPLWHDAMCQIETYLAAMCEGYVDPSSTADRNGCAPYTVEGVPMDCAHLDLGLFDYSFETLCHAAFGRKWIGSMPTTATRLLRSVETRPDGPQEFGPLPTTRLSAEVFNQYSSAVNLLTMLRVMLPWKLESRYRMLTSPRRRLMGVEGSTACGDSDCGASGKFAFSGSAPAADIPNVDWNDWADVGPGGLVDAATQASLGDQCLDFAYWALGTDRRITEFRFVPINSAMLDAVPPAWRDMVEFGANVSSLFCRMDVRSVQEVDTGTEMDCGATSMDCTFTQRNTWAAECVWLPSGTLDCGPSAPPSWFYINKRAVGGSYTIDCSGGSGFAAWLRPLTNLDVAIVIPLTDA